MNKKLGRKSLITTLLLALAFFAICMILIPRADEKTDPTSAQLFVDGKPVDDNNIVIYHHGNTFFADLPLLSVVDALGYQVTVESDDLIYLEIEETYRLSENKLYSGDGEFVCEVPGYDIAVFDREGPPGEIYLESGDLIRVLQKIGIAPIDVTINPSSKTVCLSQEAAPGA